jgi:ribonucleoside-triphosphate reductase
LDLAIQVAVERGGVVLAFDRSGNDEAISAFTARYGVNGERLLGGGSESWQWRAAIFSSVAINLPRIGYRAGGDRVRVFELLTELLELAAQASLEKRVFLEKLLARGEAGPLALLAMRPDKEPFLPLSRTAHAICPIGLAELSEAVCGNRLDSSLDAQEFAAHVVRYLHTEAGRLSAKHKVRFVLTESRDIAAAHRLARLDLKTFGQSGSEDADNVYYTNGARLPVSSSITAFDRFRIESAIQQGKILNATSDVWLGGSRPARDRFAALVSRVFRETQASALSFSPEFTVCLNCRAVSTGLVTVCTLCGSNRVDGLAQVTDRFSRTSIWPRWKLAELKRRNREAL